MNNKVNNEIEVTIEIPKGSNVKYEFDVISKTIKVDRILYGANYYPQNYGFIEETIDFDGDPLDMLVIADQSFNPGTVVPVRILGGLEMIDGGEEDTKLIGVISVDPRYKHIQNIDDVAEHLKLEIKNFFETYKLLQKKEVKIGKFFSVEHALKVLDECKHLNDKYSSLQNDSNALKAALKKDYPNKFN